MGSQGIAEDFVCKELVIGRLEITGKCVNTVHVENVAIDMVWWPYLITDAIQTRGQNCGKGQVRVAGGIRAAQFPVWRVKERAVSVYYK